MLLHVEVEVKDVLGALALEEDLGRGAGRPGEAVGQSTSSLGSQERGLSQSREPANGEDDAGRGRRMGRQGEGGGLSLQGRQERT